MLVADRKCNFSTKTHSQCCWTESGNAKMLPEAIMYISVEVIQSRALSSKI